MDVSKHILQNHFYYTALFHPIFSLYAYSQHQQFDMEEYFDVKSHYKIDFYLMMFHICQNPFPDKDALFQFPFVSQHPYNNVQSLFYLPFSFIIF